MEITNYYINNEVEIKEQLPYTDTIINNSYIFDNLIYDDIIETKIFQPLQFQVKNKKNKTSTISNFITKDNIENLFTYNYSVKQLRELLSKHKVKKIMNLKKEELIKKIYCYIFLSEKITKIQKHIRGFLTRLINKLRGPALFNRSLCTNSTDFLFLEPVKEIPFFQFFSFNDSENHFCYGFNILSLYNIIYNVKKKIKQINPQIKNPYTRDLLTPETINNIIKYLKLCNRFNIPLELKIEDIKNDITPEKMIEIKCIDIFQTINYYSINCHHSLFMNLSANKLIKFIQELKKIWDYKANLDLFIKKEICFPLGNPFSRINMLSLRTLNINKLRNQILDVMWNFVNNGINSDRKTTGCLYVLTALTYVSLEAREALPMLYQDF